MMKSSHSGNTIYMRLLLLKDSTRTELFYFDDNFRHIALWVSALRIDYGDGCVKRSSSTKTAISQLWIIISKHAMHH